MSRRRTLPTSAAFQSSPIRRPQGSRCSSGADPASSRPPRRTHRAASAGTSCSPPTGSRHGLSTATFSAGRKRTPRSARPAPYQPFSAGGQMIGGMFTKPATIPAPFWLYYFNIDDIDATAQRVTAGGGRILEGPIEVAGRQLGRPMRGPAGCGVRAGGNAERPPGRIFRARRIARCVRRAEPEMVLVRRTRRGQPGAAGCAPRPSAN